MMCVWNVWIDANALFHFHFSIAGGHSISLGLCSTKLPVKWDIQLGQLDVPAYSCLKWEEAQPKNLLAEHFFADFDYLPTSIIWIFPVRFSQSDIFVAYLLIPLFGSTCAHLSPTFSYEGMDQHWKLPVRVSQSLRCRPYSSWLFWWIQYILEDSLNS